MIIRLAWRNLWRNPARSIVIISAVILGLWAGIFLISFTYGMIEQRVKMAIETELSHIQLHNPQFLNNKDIEYDIPNSLEGLHVIRNYDFVKSATGRFITNGMIAGAFGSSGVQINGVVPNEENNVSQLKSKLLTGNYFSDKENEMIIGEKLSKKLRLKIKNKAVLSFLDRDGTITSGAFRIVGIFRTNNTPFDEGNVFVKSNAAMSLASVREFNEIAVVLHSNNDLEEGLAELKGRFNKLDVKSWNEISPEMDMIVSATDQSTYIYMSIIFLALAFGIINTMMMSVLERTRELGMLLALGMNRSKVFFMILSETLLLVFTGTPVGIGLSLITVKYFGQKGIDLSEYSEVYESFGYSSIIYPNIGVRQILIILVLVAITAIASSVFPSRKALKLNPVEAIRK